MNVEYVEAEEFEALEALLCSAEQCIGGIKRQAPPSPDQQHVQRNRKALCSSSACTSIAAASSAADATVQEHQQCMQSTIRSASFISGHQQWPSIIAQKAQPKQGGAATSQQLEQQQKSFAIHQQPQQTTGLQQRQQILHLQHSAARHADHNHQQCVLQPKIPSVQDKLLQQQTVYQVQHQQPHGTSSGDHRHQQQQPTTDQQHLLAWRPQHLPRMQQQSVQEQKQQEWQHIGQPQHSQAQPAGQHQQLQHPGLNTSAGGVDGNPSTTAAGTTPPTNQLFNAAGPRATCSHQNAACPQSSGTTLPHELRDGAAGLSNAQTVVIAEPAGGHSVNPPLCSGSGGSASTSGRTSHVGSHLQHLPIGASVSRPAGCRGLGSGSPAVDSRTDAASSSAALLNRSHSWTAGQQLDWQHGNRFSVHQQARQHGWQHQPQQIQQQLPHLNNGSGQHCMPSSHDGAAKAAAAATAAATAPASGACPRPGMQSLGHADVQIENSPANTAAATAAAAVAAASAHTIVAGVTAIGPPSRHCQQGSSTSANGSIKPRPLLDECPGGGSAAVTEQPGCAAAAASATPGGNGAVAQQTGCAAAAAARASTTDAHRGISNACLVQIPIITVSVGHSDAQSACPGSGAAASAAVNTRQAPSGSTRRLPSSIAPSKQQQRQWGQGNSGSGGGSGGHGASGGNGVGSGGQGPSTSCQPSSRHQHHQQQHQQGLVGAAGKQLRQLPWSGTVRYACTPAEVDAACKQLLAAGPPGVVGFDVEWKPSFVKGAPPNRAALLQIAYATQGGKDWRPKIGGKGRGVVVLLLQIFYSGITPKLQEVLLDDQILKVGVNIQGDVIKLVTDFGVQTSGTLDLSEAAHGRQLRAVEGVTANIQPKRWSLAGLIEEVFNLELPKPNHIRMGDWERKPLTGDQQRYAAMDAYACLVLHWELQQLPTTQTLSQQLIEAMRQRAATEEEDLARLAGGS